MLWGQCFGIPMSSLDSDTDVVASNIPDAIH